jgi:serine phosphatase RsbU (regulator of sigma subunit)
MPEISQIAEAVIEVIAPDGSRRRIPVTHSPFLMGRGGENESHLQLVDGRISRRCADIVADGAGYRLQDLGNRYGVFVNGEKIQEKTLCDGDVIGFGIDGSYEIIFHSASAPRATQTSVSSLLTRIGSISELAGATSAGGLSQLNLLLEATSLLHSQLPLDSVLGTMLDHAISITKADRGILLEPDSTGALKIRLARGSKGEALATKTLNPSQTAMNQAIERKSSVITEDLNLAGLDLKAAESIVIQNLRAVIAIPLYAMPRANSDQSVILQRGQLLGFIYLDSRRTTAFSALDRQILDALAMEAASILDNARLVEHERERQRLEQELTIATKIQQALLPHGLHDFPHLAVTGVHTPCHEVGGDYFDVFPVSDDRTAILIADVSGKGLGAALLTTMLQGSLSGLTIGADPVQLLGHINRFLCEHGEVGRYATMFIGLVGQDGMLDYVRGGHPSPLLLRGGEIIELYHEGSFPVGLVPEATFEAAQLQLEPDDTLVLFSDGVTEAEDPNRAMFGEAGLRSALMGLHGLALDALQQKVLESVNEFTGGGAQSDDITLLLVRYRAVARETTANVPV